MARNCDSRDHEEEYNTASLHDRDLPRPEARSNEASGAGIVRHQGRGYIRADQERPDITARHALVGYTRHAPALSRPAQITVERCIRKRKQLVSESY